MFGGGPHYSISLNVLHNFGSRGECDDGVSCSPLTVFSHGKTAQDANGGLGHTCDFFFSLQLYLDLYFVFFQEG